MMAPVILNYSQFLLQSYEIAREMQKKNKLFFSISDI